MIPRVLREGLHEPSFGQERLWFFDRLAPGAATNNVALVLRLRGTLDADALEESLRVVVSRHEILRSSFLEVDGRPRVRVEAEARVPFERVDLSALPSAEQADRRAREVAGCAQRRMDLEHGPVLAAKLVKLSDSEHFLVVCIHHVAADGWSFGLLREELSALYTAKVRGMEPTLPSLAVGYVDYAAWQRARLSSEALQKHVAFWVDHLKGAPGLDLPSDRPRPAFKSYEGARVAFSVSEETSARLYELAVEESASPFMVLLAAYSVLLARWSGQNDVVVGTPIAGRLCSELDPLIGVFINTLALRTSLDGDPTFVDVLRRVKETALEAYSHQEVPFEKVVEALNVPRDTSRSAVFQAFFVLQTTRTSDYELGDLSSTYEPSGIEGAKFDLTLWLHADQGPISGELEYAVALFDRATIERFAEQLVTLLESVVDNVHSPIAVIPILPAAEQERLLTTWNATHRAPAGAETLLEQFEATVARVPESVAVRGDGRSLTYAELDSRANALAHSLVAAGVKRGDLVGIVASPSMALPIALFAIWKTGAGYVPLDPALPPARLQELGRNVVALVAPAGVALELSGVPTIEVGHETPRADAPDVRPAPSDTAYVLFTSGSTGTPKGVVVEHAQLANYVRGVIERLGLVAGSYALISTFSADLGNTVLYPPFVLGGTLHVLDEDARRDPLHFRRYMDEHAIDVLKIVPSHFLALSGGSSGFPRRHLVFGGEAAKIEDMRALLQQRPEGCRVFNHYGPTETTVGVLTFDMERILAEKLSGIPLGRPLPNCRVYVLDPEGNPAPIGVYGELYIGGDQVARGYLGDAEKTAERFTRDPFVKGSRTARMYRTGDRCRWLASGDIEFAGRLDDQVKIRGFRVELGDIAAAMRRCTGVREAYVLAHDAGPRGASLAAYVVVQDGAWRDAQAIRAELQAFLPEYMIPASVTRVDALPLNANGKVDRRALPAPDVASREKAHVPPRSPLEQEIAQIWSDVLGIDEIGVNDDFFELGGHSLLVTQVISRLRAQLEQDVPVRALFEAPTVAALAARIEAGFAEAQPPAITRDAVEGPVLTFWQESTLSWERKRAPSTTWLRPVRIKLEGPLDKGALAEAVAFVLERQDALRLVLAREEASAPRRCRAQDIPIEQVDMLGASEAEVEQFARAHTNMAPFAFDGTPLIRFLLVRRADEEHALFVTWHQILHDATGVRLLTTDILEAYASFVAGRAPTIGALPFRYTDYALWERSWFENGGRAQLESARSRIAGATPLALPVTRARDSVPNTESFGTRFALDADASARFARVCQSAHVTFFMGAVALVGIMLGHWCETDDAVFVSPISTRTRAELGPLVGRFGNWVPLRVSLAGNPSVGELFARARREATSAYAHAAVPGSLVYETEDVFGHPLSRVVVNMPELDGTSKKTVLRYGGISALPESLAKPEKCRTEVAIVLIRHDKKVFGHVAGATNLFDAATIADCSERLRRLFETVTLDTLVSSLR